VTRSIRAAALALSLAALPGCAGLEAFLAGQFQKPQVSVLSVTPTAADFDGVGVEVELRVQNPNAIGVRVAGFAWQLDVDGARVAAGDAPGGLSLPANGAATSRLTARFRFADLAALAKRVAGSETVQVHVAGRVTVESPLGPIELPWSVSKEVPVPRLPRVELEGIRLGAQHGLVETEVIVRVRVSNPNAFPFPAAKVQVDVELSGERVAQAAARDLPAIAAGGAATLELPLRVSLLGAGRALLAARGGSVEVAVRGTAGFGWMQHPFDVRGRLPLP
jgi:LEA14-like dessication related protein